jgi:ankyrin repeat protein
MKECVTLLSYTVHAGNGLRPSGSDLQEVELQEIPASGENILSSRNSLPSEGEIILDLFTSFFRSVAKGRPSLLPFNPKWTATEIRALIAAGADVNARDRNDNLTPLMVAVGCADRPEAIRTPVKDADANTSNEQGWRPLEATEGYATKLEVVHTLIAAGAELNARDKDGWTPLMHAVIYRNNLNSVKALIAAGADVNARNKDGNSPLVYAVANTDNPEVVKALMYHKLYVLLHDAYPKHHATKQRM